MTSLTQPGVTRFTFGSSTPAASTSGGLFGQSNPTTTSFSFTNPTSQSLFSFRPPATTTSLFSGGSLFSDPAKSSAPTFGSGAGLFNFGSKPATSLPSLTPSVAQPAQQSGNPNEEVLKYVVALTNPQAYGDERDGVIGKMNQIMAFLGCGRAFYSNTAPPLELTTKNPFCRLKFVGYNRKITSRNEDGLVTFVVKKSAQEVLDHRQMFIDCLFRILGSRPTLTVNLESVKHLSKESCEVTVFVMETNQATGLKRPIPATETYTFLAQPTNRAALQSQAFVEEIAPKSEILEDKLKDYLSVPPQGFDASTWTQAQLHNPNKDSLIPWPIYGYEELLSRHRLQNQEIVLQKQSLANLMEGLKKVDRTSAAIQLKLGNIKRNQQLLTHRLLLVVAAEVMKFRRRMMIDKDEELLKLQLERIDSHLNGPLQFMGKINELLSRIRNQPENLNLFPKSESIQIEFSADVKMFLQRTQEALEKIVLLVNKDLKTLDELDGGQ